MAKTAQPAATPTTQPTLIYCGPPLPKGRLGQFTAFRDGLPKQVQELIAECPQIREMMIPANQMATVLRKLQNSASRESSACRQIVKHFEEKK